MEIKLDKVDRKILIELDKNCRRPLTQLSKKVRKSRQAVEYRINQLIKKGVITGFKVNINPHKLGFKLCKMYLQLKNKIEDKEKLKDFLLKNPKVNWVGECDGNWDLIFSLFVKTDYEFFIFRNEILSKFDKIIINEKSDIIIDIQQYQKMYFTNEIKPPVLLAGEIIENKLDETDKKVISELVKNARVSIVNIADKLKITPIIVRTRMKKFETKGIINQFRIDIDLKKIGLELYKTIIHLQRYSKEDERKFLESVNKISNIQYFIRNLTQIELELVAKNYQEYNEIINKIKREFSGIIRNVESVIMKSDIWNPSLIF